jgi:hypothetical protein
MENVLLPTRIAYGPRDMMIAEYGAPEYVEGAFLLLPLGDGQWDAEGYATIKEAAADAAYWVASWNEQYGVNVKIVRL